MEAEATLLTSLALIAGGIAIALIGALFWTHPQHYYRYLYRGSMWSAINRRPPEWFVKFGAGLTVVVGIVVIGVGVVQIGS